MLYQITDWDDAHANAAHIPEGAAYPARWATEAADFRAAQPPHALGRGHLFLPGTPPAGLMVFIHGGYWMRFDPSLWSHLAAGPLAKGWAVAMPAYTLAPSATLPQMTTEVAAAITDAAARVAGPIVLTGHSAGGHLAARMICDDGPLPTAVADRVRHCLPISGLFDLRPLLRTALNDTLHLDQVTAAAESPALRHPRDGVTLTAWVGGAERPEFLRQSRLIADIWAGLGVATQLVVDPGRHHFDVIDGFARADSPLTRAALTPPS